MDKLARLPPPPTDWPALPDGALAPAYAIAIGRHVLCLLRAG
jgi:hypothetical protein